jgi:hypothetical protein
MRIYSSLKALTVVVWAVLLFARADAQVARLTFQSEPGDFVGQGLSRDIVYTPANSGIFSVNVDRRTPAGEPALFRFELGGGGDTIFFSILRHRRTR